MARKRTLNERRLTKRQVEALIASGAKARPDLTAVLDDVVLQSRVYELDGDHYLLVFGEHSGLDGKGDIYAADDFHRFVRWSAKVDEDARHGRQGSTSHWAYYSPLKDRLLSNIDTLIAQLRSTMSRTPDELDFSYKSLDLVSEYVEGIGVERAQHELYDHLVAYVGEVLRLRIHGHWDLRGDDRRPYPYLVGAHHDPVMPINVVWRELSGYAPVNLRTEAANEVRRTRKPPISAVASACCPRAPAIRNGRPARSSSGITHGSTATTGRKLAPWRIADVIEEMSATVVDTSGRVEHVYADTPLAQLAAAAFLRFPVPNPSGA